MKRKSIVFIFSLLMIMSLAACSNEKKNNEDTENTNNNQLTVYTTIYPLQYFTDRIGGSHVKTENIIPSGSDAHSFEPTPKTMVQLAESDAFIYTGTGIEGFASSILEAVKNEDVLITNATEGVNFISGKETETHGADEEDIHKEDESVKEDVHEEHSEATDKDPHVWLDPKRSIKVAENIKNALIQLKPESKDEFEENFTSLKNELKHLDDEFKDMVNTSKTKTFIVSHSAYGYWEDVYGLKQIGISGLSPTDEPSQSELVEIINLVKENNLKYIFFEPNLTNKVAETVKKETGTETLTLNNLESLTNEDIKSNADYFTIMKKNIKVLDQALNSK